ncbi:exonuclease domain-containing protein [Bacillus sp. SS-TM]
MNDGKQQSTFLFHDYETFGTHPALDRPAQFAAIRTDNEFNVIGEPEVFYCKPADDFVVETHIVVAQNTGLRYGKKRVNTGGKRGFVFSFRPCFLRGNTGN